MNNDADQGPAQHDRLVIPAVFVADGLFSADKAFAAGIFDPVTIPLMPTGLAGPHSDALKGTFKPDSASATEPDSRPWPQSGAIDGSPRDATQP